MKRRRSGGQMIPYEFIITWIRVASGSSGGLNARA